MKSLLIALALIVPASAASADVGNYRWGMSRAQIVAASDGSLQVIRGDEGDRVFGSDLGVEGAYSAAGIGFRAQFYFDPAGRLSAIRLHPQDMTECDRLLDVLEGLYGLGSSTGLGKSWIDAEADNDLRFTTMDGECFVAYRPLSRQGGLGL